MRDLLRQVANNIDVERPVALGVVFTTAYLSSMFLVSRIYSSLSPTTGRQISLYIWCPRMQLGTLYS